MTSHATCQHPRTASARARCRAGRAQHVSRATATDLDFVTPAEVSHVPTGVSTQLDDATWKHLIANRARFTDTPWPTDEERAVALAKIWCTSCHLLHDLPACEGNVARRVTNVPVEPAPEPRPRMAGADMLPTFANARELAADIPEGRYAVRNAAGDFEFYKLDKPTEGRWAGYVFLKVQASDDFHAIKSAARMISVYGAIIDAGVRESSAAYGHQLGSCGVCGRTLTDADSIAAGIGPKCASKMGW